MFGLAVFRCELAFPAAETLIAGIGGGPRVFVLHDSDRPPPRKGHMLRSLNVTLDYHLAASDGLEGVVRDFLFDDETWIVQYIVAETPGQTGRRNVLIPSSVAGSPDWETKQFPVSLAREEIRSSPSIESDMPIYLQHKYGLAQPDSHLRSMREVAGYSLLAADGEIGVVEDFIVEDTLWGIQYAVAALGHPAWKSVLLSPTSITSLSWSSKAARTAISRNQAANLEAFEPAISVNRRNGVPVDYYGRPARPVPFPVPGNGGEARPH